VRLSDGRGPPDGRPLDGRPKVPGLARVHASTLAGARSWRDGVRSSRIGSRFIYLMANEVASCFPAQAARHGCGLLCKFGLGGGHCEL